MQRLKSSRSWVMLAWGTASLLFLLFLTQFLVTSGHDLDRACESVGRVLDRNFRLLHPHDGSLYFPLHNRCDAAYDLVPTWVNPALSALAAVLTLALAGALVSRNARNTSHS